ncbi:MAG: energy-coupled thiamine transporter ThiT, partial [Coriobacteriales bacterium]|nr:energy-coupled thiamine transporter ThiT [Coriobacteriales bacterium]
MRNNNILVLVEVALAVALAAVLNLLAARLPINIAGGSISLSMLPIAVVALRRG